MTKYLFLYNTSILLCYWHFANVSPYVLCTLVITLTKMENYFYLSTNIGPKRESKPVISLQLQHPKATE